MYMYMYRYIFVWNFTGQCRWRRDGCQGAKKAPVEYVACYVTALMFGPRLPPLATNK